MATKDTFIICPMAPLLKSSGLGVPASERACPTPETCAVGHLTECAKRAEPTPIKPRIFGAYSPRAITTDRSVGGRRGLT